jgi:hypothetical protein
MKTEINRVIEKYKDVKLLLLFILYTKPTQVGKLLMTGICNSKKRGDILKKTIQSKIGKDKRKLTVHADGEILAER